MYKLVTSLRSMEVFQIKQNLIREKRSRQERLYIDKHIQIETRNIVTHKKIMFAVMNVRVYMWTRSEQKTNPRLRIIHPVAYICFMFLMIGWNSSSKISSIFGRYIYLLRNIHLLFSGKNAFFKLKSIHILVYTLSCHSLYCRATCLYFIPWTISSSTSMSSSELIVVLSILPPSISRSSFDTFATCIVASGKR